MKKITATSLVSLAIVSSAAAEGWDSSFDLGATVAKGNSESTLVTAGFSTIKKEDKNEYAANLTYTFGEENSNTTIDEVLADARWNHLITDRFYEGVRFDFRTDAIADIDYRGTLSGVMGYYFVKNTNTSLALEIGAGFSAEQVGGISDEYFSIYFGERFEHKLNENTRIYQSLSVTAPADEAGNFSLIGEAGIETSLSDTLTLKVYVQDKFENQPALGQKKNDFKLVTGISYKF